MSLFDINGIKQELITLEEQTVKEGFWQKDPKETGKILSQIKQLKAKKESYENAESEITNLQDLTELAEMENDSEVAKDILKSTQKLEKEIEKIQLETLLSGKYYRSNSILTLHPGEGGTE